ncbi:hypothetical protein [Kineosporia sp. A_224]|uniref:hypothetical protein n=1 Tax=Kineosporia sp. A_224 TaxID=1962180 RepID=UPI00117AAB71|nr:hypothetical protein [Kineosporia sp. A_224]
MSRTALGQGQASGAGVFTSRRGGVEAASLHLAPDGVLLGHDRGGQDVRLHLFRERVGSVLLVGDLRAAAVLVALVLGAGARVCVLTSRRASWQAVADALGVTDADLELRPTDAPLPESGTFAEPLLMLQDSGASVSPIRPAPGPWRTTLTLVNGVTPGVVATARGAHVVLSQRLTESASRTLVRDGLGLDHGYADELAGLENGVLAVMTRQAFLPVVLDLTADGLQAVLGALAQPPNPRARAKSPVT